MIECACQAAEPFPQDGVGLIPQGQGKTELLLIVAHPQQAVFTPAVGMRAGKVMREEIPGCSVGGNNPLLPTQDIYFHLP